MMVDVKNPHMNYSWSANHSILNLKKAPVSNHMLSAQAVHFLKVFFTSSFVLFMLFGAYNAYALIEANKTLKSSGEKISANFSRSVDDIKNLDPEKAAVSLRENTAEMKRVTGALQGSNAIGIMNVLGRVIPTFRDAGVLLSSVTSLNLNFLKFAEATSDLKQNGFKNFQSNGALFLASMTNVRTAIKNIIANAQTVKNTTANLKTVSSYFATIDDAIGGKYLAHSADLYRADTFLGDLLAFFGSDGDRHILFLFQNPAEIRPGGGFIGSYADITIAGGQMKNIDVRDIYDPDGWFLDKVIPPYQLQTVSENWGARDANWFFDFPTSAKTVVNFLEASKIYSEKGITFDGAVAVNIPVIKTMLDATGPIPLPEYKLVIDSNNFLTEVQREVEAGKDKAAGQPKKILKVLTPLLLEKMKGLDADAQRAFIKELGERIAKKDIMFYAKNTNLASYIDSANVGGAVYELPQSFMGTYLAVVDANVAGGKTDALIAQSVNATINVDTAGSILTDLVITREHKGGNEKDPWWNTENKNFVQVLVNPDSQLVSMKGNTIKKIVPTFNYESNGYSANADLAAIDGSRIAVPNLNAWTMKEFGKTAFATWFNTPAGKTGTLTLRYHTDNTALAPLESGSKYTFVYERQSGVQTALNVNITAPVGFVWKESGTPNYSYTNEDPDGRVTFDLQLQQQ